MFCVLLVLNIFVAFILEAFILEYNIGAGKTESAVERKIKEMGLNIEQKRNTRWFGGKGDRAELADNEMSRQSPQTPKKVFEKECVPEFLKQDGLRFHLKKNSRKSVLVLLQSMFENELSPEDLGPDDIDDIEDSIPNPRSRVYTIDSITWCHPPKTSFDRITSNSKVVSKLVPLKEQSCFVCWEADTPFFSFVEHWNIDNEIGIFFISANYDNIERGLRSDFNESTQW